MNDNTKHLSPEKAAIAEEWLQTHSLSDGCKIVDAWMFKSNPMLMLHNPGDIREWCIQYRGSGHYFRHKKDAQMWADWRMDKSKALPINEVYERAMRGEPMHIVAALETGVVGYLGKVRIATYEMDGWIPVIAVPRYFAGVEIGVEVVKEEVYGENLFAFARKPRRIET